MKPNFKDIDIVKDAFGDLHVPETTGEESVSYTHLTLPTKLEV